MKITHKRFDRLELYRLAEDPYTINLRGYKTPRQIKKDIEIEKFRAKIEIFILNLAKILLLLSASILFYTIINRLGN